MRKEEQVGKEHTPLAFFWTVKQSTQTKTTNSTGKNTESYLFTAIAGVAAAIRQCNPFVTSDQARTVSIVSMRLSHPEEDRVCSFFRRAEKYNVRSTLTFR